MITLINGDIKKKFSIRQAQNMLYIQGQMRSNCWKLEDDSPYEFIDNALIKRPSKKNSIDKAAKQAITDGDKA